MINLMNYYEHPADNRYYIFEYRDVEKSMCFEELLDESGVTFEKLVQEETPEKVWHVMYAIAKSDFKSALKANNLTEGKYRNPLIPNTIARYAFVIIMLGLVGIAFYGYMVSK